MYVFVVSSFETECKMYFVHCYRLSLVSRSRYALRAYQG